MPEIRKATAIPPGSLTPFFAAAWPDRAAFLDEHWRWLYRVDRFPGLEPLALVDAGKVVGFAGSMPVKIAHDGRESTAIWFVDFSILPEWRGKGHGKALTEAWMATCPRRITFCNDESMRVFLKLGWTERTGAFARSFPLELAGPMRRRWGAAGAAAGVLFGPAARLGLRALTAGAPALKVSPLPPDSGGLAEKFDEPMNMKPRVPRDADWVRWRLLENPRRAEHFLAETGGAAGVFRLFESLGRRRAHLLLVGPGKPEARAGLVKGFARWALDSGADDAWLAGTDAVLLAAAAPVLSRERPVRFAWSAADPASAELLSAPLPTQSIDSDHDLMFP
ncbi:MAG: GNAT family N-acetyltransferase [Elusimicrobiota bacterium]|nr:MAG: GNAT family N-acetyltransferase [Elusimicrobiota bacterium]